MEGTSSSRTSFVLYFDTNNCKPNDNTVHVDKCCINFHAGVFLALFTREDLLGIFITAMMNFKRKLMTPDRLPDLLCFQNPRGLQSESEK